MDKIDWVELETLYVAGKMSLRELAKEQGVSFSRVSDYSRKNNWTQKRKRHRDKTVAKGLGRAQARGARKLDEVLRAVEKTADMAMAALENENQFCTYITDGEERVYSKLDTKALKEYAAAMRDISTTLREFYGVGNEGSVKVEFVKTEGAEK